MSKIKNKLEQFFGTAWSTPIDKEVCNSLMKNKDKMLNDSTLALQYINNFKNKNKEIYLLCSNELTNMIEDIISQPLTESMEQQVYDGVWEDTSLKIKDIRERKIKPETIKKIKAMALEDYGIRLFNADDKSQIEFYLIVPKIPMSKSVHFSNDCKIIDKNLVAVPFVYSKRNFNIANKVNKANRLLAMQENDLSTIAMKLLEAHGFGYNVNKLIKLVNENKETIEDICESASTLDVNRLVAMMEIKDIKENDTSDINVPDRFVGALQSKKRLQNFDPYETVANVSPGSKSVIQFTPEKFNESIRSISIPNIIILENDILETELISNVILESKGIKTKISFLKNDFINFVKDNTNCLSYLEEGKINFEKYIKSRPFTFQTILFKEYFFSKLNEMTDQNFTVDITEVDNNTNQIKVGYFYPNDSEYSWKILSLEEFKEWLENNDWQYADYIPRTDYNKFLEFWDLTEESDRNDLVYKFILSKNNMKIQESTTSIRYDDYNVWKSDVATQTNNDFNTLKSKNNKENKINAVDANMNIIGNWDYKNNIGYLRK